MLRLTILCYFLGGIAICDLVGNRAVAEAAEFKSEAGISFQYPDEWTVLSELNQEQFTPAVQAYVKESQIDLRAIHVMVVRLNDSDFQENMNVVITPHEVPVTASSIEKFLPQIKSQNATTGIQMSELSGDLITIADRQAINLTFKTKLPFEDNLLQQRQVLIPGGGQTFTITFTALPTTYSQHVGAFDSVLQSLKLAPQQSSFNWDAIGRLCGTMIGVPIGVIVFFQIKKRWGKPASPKA